MIKLLDTRDWLGSQSWNRTTLLSLDDKRLKVSIKYDSYSNQSHGEIRLWDGSQWQFVASIPYPQLSGVRHGVRYIQKLAPVKAFDEDFNELVDMAQDIIGA